MNSYDAAMSELIDMVRDAIAVPSNAGSLEVIEILFAAWEQAADGVYDKKREFVLRSIASGKCEGSWSGGTCLDVDAMHLCPSCYVTRYLRTGDMTLRATEHLAAEVIAGAITAYRDTFKRHGRVDLTYWPSSSEVEVHVHTDERGNAEPHQIFRTEGAS